MECTVKLTFRPYRKGYPKDNSCQCIHYCKSLAGCVVVVVVLSGGLNQTTLAIAKSNVQEYYSVVGLQEDLPSLFDVLDVIAPSIFRNTSAVYGRICES